MLNQQELYDGVLQLLGLQIVHASHAASLRGFQFAAPGQSQVSPGEVNNWFLHINCCWRLESEQRIVTGSYDWLEPADGELYPEDGWDPAAGGSLQEAQLRQLFANLDASKRTICNNTDFLVVEAATVDVYGSVELELSGRYRLRVFPSGSHGEFWRVFRKGDLESHVVCETGDDSGPSSEGIGHLLGPEAGL